MKAPLPPEIREALVSAWTDLLVISVRREIEQEAAATRDTLSASETRHDETPLRGRTQVSDDCRTKKRARARVVEQLVVASNHAGTRTGRNRAEGERAQ